MQKLIGLVKARLLGYIAQAEKILSSPIRTEAIEEDKINTDDLMERMTNNFLF